MARGGFMPGGGGGNMQNLMKQAQQMQRKMAEAVAEIEAADFNASAGGGVVEAVVTGERVLKSLTIKPEAVDPDDVEMLQDLVITAVNAALNQAADAMEKATGALTGGMKLPGF